MKKINLAVLLMIFSTLAFSAQAQDKPDESLKKETPKQTTEKLTAKDYEEMLGKLKKGDFTIDFVKLRLAYTETKDFSPYGGSAERSAMFQAFNKKEYKDALKAAEKILDTNFVDLNAQYVAAISIVNSIKQKNLNFTRKFWKVCSKQFLKMTERPRKRR
jgi:outer membrane protein assembly factor BamD (BamD/ComL family)